MGAFTDVVLLWSRSLSVIKLYHAQSAKAIVSCTRWCYVVLVSNNGLTVIDKSTNGTSINTQLSS